MLERVLKLFKEDSRMQWHTFLGCFTKRGRLRDNEKLNLQLDKKVNSTTMFEDLSTREDALEETMEEKEYRLRKELK